MALSRVKTWSAGEVLTASDLNSEFNNVLNNALSLVSPFTGTIDLNGNEFILDSDADSSITADTDDRVDFRLGGTDIFRLNTVASAVNGIDFFGSITATAPYIIPQGTDTDIDLNLKGKGTGRVLVNSEIIGRRRDTFPSLFAAVKTAELQHRMNEVSGSAEVILASQIFS